MNNSHILHSRIIDQIKSTYLEFTTLDMDITTIQAIQFVYTQSHVLVL